MGLLLRVLLVSLLSGITIQAFGQQDREKELLIEQKIENLAENAADTEVDYTLMLDELLYYAEHPINLNKTTKEELQNLDLLSELQIIHLLEHIEKNGSLLSIIELQAVKGFDLYTIQRILPFVKVSLDLENPAYSIKRILENGQHQFIARYQTIYENQKGYLNKRDTGLLHNSGYLGSKEKLYTRYIFKHGHKLSVGFTGEKDPGEEFFKGTQKQGFDFYSAHLFVKNAGIIKSLAIGDYQVQFGQGLSFWSGLSFGKSSFALNQQRLGIGLRPYGSVDENRFMRGGGITLGFNNFESTVFVSHKNIDANISSIPDTNWVDQEPHIKKEITVTSFQQTGFHRTLTEIAGKNSVMENILGGNLAYKKRNFSIGTTVVKSVYDGLIQRNLSFYNQFEFNGSKNINLGIDYNWIFQNMNFFGEFAKSINEGYAFVNGVLMSVDPRLSLTIIHRKYEKEYQSVYGAGPGEGTRNSNEQGIYTGMVLIPAPRFSIAAYYDRFIFPWMRYLVDAPSYGSDGLVQGNYTLSKTTEMYIRIRQRNGFKNVSEDFEEINPIAGSNQTNYRYNINYQLTPHIKLMNRVEFIEYKFQDNPDQHGYLILQDLVYKPIKQPLALTLRWALFDTDSWDSRVYAYESDIMYSFSIPAYYMRGDRFFAMIQYTLKRKIDIWIRFGQSYFYNRNTIGTGLEEIEGNRRSEIKMQLRYKF